MCVLKKGFGKKNISSFLKDKLYLHSKRTRVSYLMVLYYSYK